MLCREIMQVIEAAYPREAALDFDNVGLLAGRAEKEVEPGIYRAGRHGCCHRPRGQRLGQICSSPIIL